jgi:hypothetical protein
MRARKKQDAEAKAIRWMVWNGVEQFWRRGSAPHGECSRGNSPSLLRCSGFRRNLATALTSRRRVSPKLPASLRQGASHAKRVPRVGLPGIQRSSERLGERNSRKSQRACSVFRCDVPLRRGWSGRSDSSAVSRGALRLAGSLSTRRFSMNVHLACNVSTDRERQSRGVPCLRPPTAHGRGTRRSSPVLRRGSIGGFQFFLIFRVKAANHAEIPLVMAGSRRYRLPHTQLPTA